MIECNGTSFLYNIVNIIIFLQTKVVFNLTTIDTAK